MELTKLIEQYEQETGKKGRVSLGLNFYQYSDDFVEWLASQLKELVNE